MTTPTKYFHDRSVLALLALNSVLLVVGVLLVLFRLDASKGSSYIIQYRSGVALGEYKTGSGLEMSSFIFFLIITFAVSVLVSMRSYQERRQIAVSILMMTSLLSLLAIIVSEALLILR